MELSLKRGKFHTVRRGQTLCGIARAYRTSPYLLARLNGLSGEVTEGQVLCLPQAERNLYRVRGGESKSKLCGSPERYFELNGTHVFYLGQVVCI